MVSGFTMGEAPGWKKIPKTQDPTQLSPCCPRPLIFVNALTTHLIVQ